MDDIQALIATLTSNIVNQTHEYITKQLYEHDQPQQLFTIKQTNIHSPLENIFLDYITVITQNRKNIKTIYHNKNKTTTTTNTQAVSRLYTENAPTHISIKLTAISTLLIKIHDTTTLPQDFIIPTFQILHKIQTLGYTHKHFQSILTQVNKSRPHETWNTIHLITKTLHKHLN